jgi:universal stress protein E
VTGGAGGRTQLRRIAVGIDLGPGGTALTPGSACALRQAALVARRFAGSLCLVHSSASDEHWDEPHSGYVVREGVSDGGRAALEAALAELHSDSVEATLVSSEERASLALLRQARELDADLVMVGKRSHEGRHGQKLGSVSLALVTQSPWPVWVVQYSADPALKKILAATDLSPVGDKLVALAGALAQRFDAELHVAHAIGLPFQVQFEGAEAEARFAEKASSAAAERIHAALVGTEHEVPPRLHIGIDAPTQAILAGEQHLRPDLVVLGSVSRGGIAGFLLGNTADRLLGCLKCSILTVKPDDFVFPLER